MYPVKAFSSTFILLFLSFTFNVLPLDFFTLKVISLLFSLVVNAAISSLETQKVSKVCVLEVNEIIISSTSIFPFINAALPGIIWATTICPLSFLSVNIPKDNWLLDKPSS